MNSFSFNIADLEDAIKEKSVRSTEVSKIPYSINEKKFTKLAFDMFQSKYDDTIWELAEDNEEKFLVKRTDLDSASIEVKANTAPLAEHNQDTWSTKQSTPVVLCFLSVPIKEFDPTTFGYDNKSTELFAKTVINVVKTNSSIAQQYITAMDNRFKQVLEQECATRLIDDEVRQVYSWLKNT